MQVIPVMKRVAESQLHFGVEALKRATRAAKRAKRAIRATRMRIIV